LLKTIYGEPHNTNRPEHRKSKKLIGSALTLSQSAAK